MTGEKTPRTGRSQQALTLIREPMRSINDVGGLATAVEYRSERAVGVDGPESGDLDPWYN